MVDLLPGIRIIVETVVLTTNCIVKLLAHYKKV